VPIVVDDEPERMPRSGARDRRAPRRRVPAFAKRRGAKPATQPSSQAGRRRR
jgi:hypothetical protein